ncbi:MAG: ATP-binding protein [Bacteroidota bacterium]
MLLEGLNEAALTFTPDGTILYCNSRFSELTRISPSRLIGSHIRGVITPGERELFIKALRQLAGGSVRREFRIRAADHSVVPVLFSIKSLDLGGMAVYCAVATDISDRVSAEQALQESETRFRELYLDGQRVHRELQNLSREMLRVEEEERTRISREIHDEIGQALTAISLNLKKLETHGKPSEAKKIQTVENLIEKAFDFIHLFSRQIHPGMLEDLGLFPALRSFVRDFQKNTGMRVDLKLSGKTGLTSVEQKTALYRIVQESLTNVVKHSGTRAAVVTIKKSPKVITLEVADKGKGLEFPGRPEANGRRHGLGILGMQERARQVGGRFMILSRPGKGTKVRVLLPLVGADFRINRS